MVYSGCLLICRCEMMQKSEKSREKRRRNDLVRSFLLTFFTFRFFFLKGYCWWKNDVDCAFGCMLFFRIFPIPLFVLSIVSYTVFFYPNFNILFKSEKNSKYIWFWRSVSDLVIIPVIISIKIFLVWDYFGYLY